MLESTVHVPWSTVIHPPALLQHLVRSIRSTLCVHLDCLLKIEKKPEALSPSLFARCDWVTVTSNNRLALEIRLLESYLVYHQVEIFTYIRCQ